MARVFQRGGRWWLDYTDHRGQRVRRPGSTDKGVAQKLLGDTLDRVEKLKAGILSVDPREADRAFDHHLRDYLTELQRLGRAVMYRYIIERRLKAAAWACAWARSSRSSPGRGRGRRPRSAGRGCCRTACRGSRPSP